MEINFAEEDPLSRVAKKWAQLEISPQ